MLTDDELKAVAQLAPWAIGLFAPVGVWAGLAAGFGVWPAASVQAWWGAPSPVVVFVTVAVGAGACVSALALPVAVGVLWRRR